MKFSKNHKQQQPPAPVIDLVVRYDGRDGSVRVAVIGGQMTPADGRRLLDAAKEQLVQMEIQATAQQQAPGMPPMSGSVPAPDTGAPSAEAGE